MLDSVCISVSFLPPGPTMQDSVARVGFFELHTGTHQGHNEYHSLPEDTERQK